MKSRERTIRCDAGQVREESADAFPHPALRLNETATMRGWLDRA
jgi:hypothetical protein